MNVDFYKELHLREFSRKKELDDSVNMPIGLITIIGGILSFFIKEHQSIKSDCLILILFSIIVITLITSIYFIICSLNNFIVNNSYQYLAFPDELLKYQKEIRQHNIKCSSEEEKLCFEKYLVDSFAEIATFNKKTNDKRGIAIYNAKSCLVLAVLLSLVLIIIYLLQIF